MLRGLAEGKGWDQVPGISRRAQVTAALIIKGLVEWRPRRSVRHRAKLTELGKVIGDDQRGGRDAHGHYHKSGPTVYHVVEGAKQR